MTIWYDVSDLAGWRYNHLTGIQRTIVGVLNGMVEHGAQVRLVRFDHRSGFVEVKASSLPQAVLAHMPWAGRLARGDSTELAHAEMTRADESRVRRRELRRDASRALKEFERAGRVLRKSTWRLLRASLGLRVKGALPVSMQGPAAPNHGPVRPVRQVAAPVSWRWDEPVSEGDVLLSTAASWGSSGYADAVAHLRARGMRVVRTIYDMIPALKPEWVDDPDQGVFTSRAFAQWARRLITESDCVLTISEFSRREILRYCAEAGVSPAPIAVMRLGDDFGQLPESPPLPRFVPERPFFLCVSTLDVRKNHRLLYDAWCTLAARDPSRCPDLVCVGMLHLYVNDLLREIRLNRDVNGRIHFVRDCMDAELEWYFRRCTASIYPSRYEGWGLPVAESLSYGRLVLASSASSITEISPDLPVFFDPLDSHALVSLVERALSDPDWVRACEDRIKAGFRPTPWARTASQVLAAVESIRRRPVVAPA